MKYQIPPRSSRAFTALDLLVLIIAIAVQAAIILPLLARPRQHRHPAMCVNNLKQIGLAFRIYSADNNDHYPMQLLTNLNGAPLAADSTNLFRYFQVISNELNTPRILVCPQDNRKSATNYMSDFDSRKLSYFVGLDADESLPGMLLSGDRNMTNGLSSKRGMLTLATNQPVGWTAAIHNKTGNIALADGSVQQLNSALLKNAVANTGTNLNRLLFP